MVSRLKRVNPDLKIMLSVGSYKEGTVPFLKMAETARKRRDFVRNTIKYLKKYDLDGVELNWNIRNIDLGLFGNSSEQKRARSSFSRIVQVRSSHIINSQFYFKTVFKNISNLKMPLSHLILSFQRWCPA